MEPLPADSVLVQNQHYLAPSGDLFAFLGDDYLPNGYVNITGGGSPVTPTDRVGATSTAVVDSELFVGDADAIDNTSLFYMDNAGVNAPPFANTDGGIITATSSADIRRQLWFGRNGVLGIRGGGTAGTYDPWVQMAALTDIPDPQNLQEVTEQGNTTDQAIHISADNNDPATPGMSLIATPASGTAEIINRGGNSDIGWIFLGNMGANGAIRTSPGGGNGAQPVTIFGGTTPTGNISITAPGKITCDPGTNPTDVVVLSQLDDYLLSVVAGTNVTIDSTDPQNPIINASGGVTSVDLGYTASPTNGIVTNSAGDNATLTAATATNAGLLLPGEKTLIVSALQSGDNVSELTNDAGYITDTDIPESVTLDPALLTTPTTGVIPPANDLESYNNTHALVYGGTVPNIPTPSTGVSFMITSGVAAMHLAMSATEEDFFLFRKKLSPGDVWGDWFRLASRNYVDTNAVQDLQSVTDEGSVTTSTIQHASATEANQSLTGENLGFALGWNGNTLEVDWGETQTIAGVLNHSIFLAQDEAINFGNPQTVANPLFHLVHNADPATSEWQLRTTAATATNKAIFNGSGSLLQMRITDASDNSKGIEISRLGQMSVIDSINETGMVYNDDYSANYTDRSIVDKAYVDSVAGNVIALPGTVSFPQVPANSSVDGTNTVSTTSADVDDYVIVTETGGGTSVWETIFIGRVSAPGAITVRRYNPTTSAIPAETDLTLRLFLVKFN